MDKLSYPVLSPLRFDGKLYSPGDAAEMTEDEAATLPPGILGEPTPVDPEAPVGKAKGAKAKT